MSDILEDLSSYGPLLMLVVGFGLMFASGIFFGIVYFALDQTNTALLTTDCVISDNSLVESCQGLFTLAVYPFLALKELLIWLSFFFIFSIVLGMLIVGYQSGKSPVLMGMLITFVAGLTYIGILLSNVYRTLLDNLIFRNMMLNFTVYNKIMLNFPWFTFFIGIFSVMLSLVNFQRTRVNEDPSIQDY